MLMAVTYLTLISRLPYGIALYRSCVPNTQFLLNGRLCYCNAKGQYNDASCQMIGRRQACQPGQIIWEECSQCICQENGKLLCTNAECTDVQPGNKSRGVARSGFAVWCTPFRSYYVNCTLCVCPASGKMSEARCATDSSCALKGVHVSLDTIPKNICIPKVMYLFTCLHCLCSDDGVFLKSKCIETCHKQPESAKRCLSRSFYRADCNICRCPDNGIPDDSVCSKSTCSLHSKLTSLHYLRNITTSCAPNKFTKPRCIYCECNSEGIVNERACIEQDCLKIDDFNYDSVKTTCTAGEMVPSCMECFCPRSKLSIEKYCTTVCSSQNKLAVLESVLKEKVTLIDRTMVKETAGTDSCDPNSLFLDQGRYCLCSDDGNTNSKHCTSVLEDTVPKKPSRIFDDKDIPRRIDINVSCEPNTYVEYGCNSCYCPKSGQIDVKWCTNDDCDAKKEIHESYNKVRSGVTKIMKDADTSTCVPGSISKVNCNFCICSRSGLVSERSCTKNTCSGVTKTTGEEFSCEPSAYYTVDCNMCYCPTDGVKNVDKCTKNQCETNFLRSDSCTPGSLFSDDCNICVCPPNGDKRDKVCTNKTCSENDTPWKKIFKISQTLLDNQVTEDKAKTFQPCFPGEEFEVGCKVCLCPEMGLKEYASCTSMLCDETSTVMNLGSKDVDELLEDLDEPELTGFELGDGRRDYDDLENCKVYNLTDSSERNECTPGSEYILKCRICICPYMGSISQFCREMPEDRYCEQAFPGFNYVPMGRRRNIDGNITYTNETITPFNYPITIYVPHNHTKYRCKSEGRITDDCYLCECEDNVLIREHCYKSDTPNCTDATGPSFIKLEDRINMTKN